MNDVRTINAVQGNGPVRPDSGNFMFGAALMLLIAFALAHGKPSGREIMRVRRLTPDDVATLRSLNALFGEAFEDPETYGGAPPDDSYLRQLLAKEHVIALVTFIEEQLVGGLVAYELEKFERARREIYIYDLAVREPYRRQGVATALIERLGELAAERGAWVIYVQADYTDPPAIALYEKLGTREEVLHFDIDVKN